MSDHPPLIKFLKKDYRDEYLQTQVRGGIAYQIQALREKVGLNQTDFAKEIGKPQSVVSRLENTEYGKVTVQTLLDIACALGVALVVKFVSYPEFFTQTADMSPEALQPKTIGESFDEMPSAKAVLDKVVSSIDLRTLEISSRNYQRATRITTDTTAGDTLTLIYRNEGNPSVMPKEQFHYV